MDAQLVEDLRFADPLHQGTGMREGGDGRSIALHELRDPRDSVADDVVQKAPRKVAHPVRSVAEQRPRIVGVPEVIGEIALQMHRRAAKIYGAHETPRLAPLSGVV